jgi:peptidoglycan/LPS O-acetylase OafA/YrhL
LGDRFIYYLNAKDTVRHLLFVGNKYVFWSIGPEVQFYLVFVGLWWLRDRLKRGATSVLIVAALAAGLVLFAQPFVPGTLVFSKFHIFLAGIVMAAAAARLPDAQSLTRSTVVWGIQLLAIGLVVALTFTPYAQSTLLNPHHIVNDISNTIYGDYRWLILMSAILLVIAVDTPVSRTLFANPLGRLAGNYSFSVYLLHEPVMMGARNVVAPFHLSPSAQVVIALLATAAIGPVCYLLVEKPSQNWFRARLGALAAAFVARQLKAGPEADLTTARTTG